MLARRVPENALVVLLALLLVLNAAFKAATWLWVNHGSLRVIDDVPWPTSQTEVVIQWDSWTRYTLDSPTEWAALYPYNGLALLGPSHTPHTVSMLHQLRCLDVVRAQLTRARAQRDTEPTRHCMNYLRQMSACHANLDFEPNQYVHEVNPVHPHPVHRCADWRPVYEALRRNREGGDGSWVVEGAWNGTAGRG